MMALEKNKFNYFETHQHPRMTRQGLEVSVHTCPRSLSRELAHVFQGQNIDFSYCLAVPTNQRADTDLVNIGEEVEGEKDRLLNVFMDFASCLCNEIKSHGYWADYIDPCSGLPMMSGGNKVYSEVEGMQLLLRYQVLNAGACRVLLHPSWGSAVYPASCFTTAPPDIIANILQDHFHDQRETQSVK